MRLRVPTKRPCRHSARLVGPREFVAIGYNLAQNSGGGPTLNQLTLNLYDASNVLQSSFSLASPTTYTEADRTLQQGNGNGVFVFVLDAAQRAAWNLLHPQDAWKVGLFANMGCAGTETATCQASNAGPDSFLAIAAGNPIINPQQGPGDVPLPAAVWMFGSGLVGLAEYLFAVVEGQAGSVVVESRNKSATSQSPPHFRRPTTSVGARELRQKRAPETLASSLGPLRSFPLRTSTCHPILKLHRVSRFLPLQNAR